LRYSICIHRSEAHQLFGSITKAMLLNRPIIHLRRVHEEHRPNAVRSCEINLKLMYFEEEMRNI